MFLNFANIKTLYTKNIHFLLISFICIYNIDLEKKNSLLKLYFYLQWILHIYFFFITWLYNLLKNKKNGKLKKAKY